MDEGNWKETEKLFAESQTNKRSISPAHENTCKEDKRTPKEKQALNLKKQLAEKEI